MTNFTPKGTKKGPLARLLRQLRLRWEDFALVPQIGSAIAFPGVTLRFTTISSCSARRSTAQFPGQKDNFERLVGDVDRLRRPGPADRDALGPGSAGRDHRRSAAGRDDLCPLMFYGSAREHDMDFAQFSIMFRSIFFEGLARPLAGVRLILRSWCASFASWGANCGCAAA